MTELYQSKQGQNFLTDSKLSEQYNPKYVRKGNQPDNPEIFS